MMPTARNRGEARRALALGAVLLLTAAAAARAGSTVIFEAIRANDIFEVNDLLDRAPNLVHSRLTNNVSPLHLAAAEDLRAVAFLLCHHGADVNAVTTSGFTPLHWAAAHNAVNATDLLLEMGADPALRSKSGLTAMEVARRSEAKHVLRALAAAGASLPADGGGEDETARPASLLDLQRALRSNDVERVDLIIARDPEALGAALAGGATALHLAAAGGDADITALLATRGADPDARTPGGFTPLHWAASRDRVESAKVLIAMGADINAPADNDITPLHWAAGRNATNMVKLLLAVGADTASETATGLTPLHWAVKKGGDDAALLLAYRKVASDVEHDVAEGRIEFPARYEEHPPAPPPPAPPAPMPAERRPVFGRPLRVDLGRGESLSFVWVASLGLWFSRFETTNGQYRRFKPRHSSLFHENFTLDDPDQPVVYVSWHDADAYCRWLNQHLADRIPKGCVFRLPTGREWRAAARCGDDRPYPWGNKWPPLYGNFSDLTARRHLPDWVGIKHYDDGYPVTCPVRHSGANAWDIYGLAGNVWEWCSDWFDADKSYKLRLGGSWDYDRRESLRIDARGFDRPGARYDTIGFRVVVAPRVRRPAVSAGAGLWSP